MFALYQDESSCWFQFREVTGTQAAHMVCDTWQADKKGVLLPGKCSGPFAHAQDPGGHCQHLKPQALFAKAAPEQELGQPKTSSTSLLHTRQL